MIFLQRRRLYVWLFRAYIKKWRKTILLSFVIGLVVFFILRFGVNYFVPLLPFTQQKTIGVVGAYTVDTLPYSILGKVSEGLTTVASDDTIKPGIAKSWEIKNSGKTYIFHLKDNIYFNDGKKLTSDEIKYDFLDVSVERPNKYTIIFNLKTVYSPFLVTVSRPVFKNGFVGVGSYRVSSINLNGNFVESISLVTAKSGSNEISYQFYPTQESLKTALVLGDISEVSKVTDVNYHNEILSSFPNTKVTKSTDYSQLVTLFYNTTDKDLSDKRLREALSYTIPDSFSEGQRNYGPFSPSSWVSQNGLTTYSQDFDHAKRLLKASSSSSSASFSFVLDTLPQYDLVANQIKTIWKTVGVNVTILEVDSIPANFQLFLGDFYVPSDPDQYSIWHSSQTNNITNYKNLRIDKLLEDGRQTIAMDQRIKIYEDFQKYLLDDPPAIFLYFPYIFEVTKK